ncbi:MAG: single-stranded DNA-binding protein [Desulfosporosinus sp. BRH_c37]|nr:MAG: single-stranded DNA-binding protein [Desulfosporosinus sp. BRH_c37]
MLNRVVLIGRLTKDPELRYTPNGIAVCNFTLAIDRNFKNAQGERDTDFINCVVYRQLAELCANYLAKGKLAAVDGRIQVRSYTAQDDQKRWVTEVIAENVRFLSPKDSGSGSTGGASSYGHEVNIADDDIPF